MSTLFGYVINAFGRLLNAMDTMAIFSGLTFYMMIFYLMLLGVILWFFKKLIQHTS